MSDTLWLVPGKCLHLDPSRWVEPKEPPVLVLEEQGAQWDMTVDGLYGSV